MEMHIINKPFSGSISFQFMWDESTRK